MEGDHTKRSKAKCTDAIAAEQSREVAGNGRAYYECTFCKMGFSNAQALGGHMNIHRRDRARMQPKQPKVETEMGAADCGYLNNDADATYYWSRNAYCSPPAASWRNYSDHFPASSSGGMGGVDAYVISSGMPQEQGPYDEELRLSLDTGSRGSHAAEEGEIDLELRLGR